MYIKKSLLVLSFLFFVICSVYAGNIGRNVYGVYSESLTGAHIVDTTKPTYDDDSVVFGVYPGADHVTTIDMTTGGVEEGQIYTRASFAVRGDSSLFYSFANNSRKDMSDYYGGVLKFLVRINKGAERFGVGMTLGTVIFQAQVLTKLSGFDASKIGQWQEVSMVLNETTHDLITRDNLRETGALFVLRYTQYTQEGNDSSDGDDFIVVDYDYVRWVKPDASTTTEDFSVELKKLNGSVVSVNSITWDSSNFQQGWRVAEQFLEIDHDVDSSPRNWNIKIYTDNGDKSRNGLYATDKNGKDYVMTMCWRASEKALPYADAYENHTLLIAQGHTGDYDYLYDSGSSSTDYAPWLYMQDLATLTASTATDKDRDYSTVMGHKKGGNSGYHGYSGDYDNVNQNGYYSGSKVNLYLGANCDVCGGLKYTGNIVVALEYE